MLPSPWAGCCNAAGRGIGPGRVTNRLAVILVVLILAALAGDLLLGEGEISWFLARRFVDLIEWASFWR